MREKPNPQVFGGGGNPFPVVVCEMAAVVRVWTIPPPRAHTSARRPTAAAGVFNDIQQQ